MPKNDDALRRARRDLVHPCVNLQRMLAEGTEWKMPGLRSCRTSFPLPLPIRKRQSISASSRRRSPARTSACARLATMLGAIDWGFRVIFVTDALCSSTDETHDAMMTVYLNRFGEQVETVTTETLLESWQGTPQRKVA